MDYHIKKPEFGDEELIKSFRNEYMDMNMSFDGCGRLEKFEDPNMWIKDCLLYENASYLPDGWPITYQYIYANSKMIAGMIDYRIDIDKSPFLRIYGGHIGYSIRPSLRNKGLGKKMLSDFLIYIKNEFDVEEVLVTCLKSNIASKKTIIACGGKYIDEAWYEAEKDYIERYSIEI